MKLYDCARQTLMCMYCISGRLLVKRWGPDKSSLGKLILSDGVFRCLIIVDYILSFQIIFGKCQMVETTSNCCTPCQHRCLLCYTVFWAKSGSLLITSQLSFGRSWCQNGQEGEGSSAYYTVTTIEASLGSHHEYLDNCWPGLMCIPISDGYPTPLKGLTTGLCQAAMRFQYCSTLSIIRLC